MGEMIELRNGDPLHGGRAELLVMGQGGGIPANCPAIIRRGTTKDPFLGPQGWQAVEHDFHPAEAYEEAGRLVLRFGPELVDNVLRDDDIVQIDLPVLGVSDVIAWSGITRSVTVSDVPVPPERDRLKGVVPPPPPAGIALAAIADRPGWIAVTITGGPPLPPGQAVAFRRTDDAAPVLGAAGWQSGAHAFTQAAREPGDGSTRLLLELGAAASAVPPGSPIEVTLPGTGISGRADWPALPGPVMGNPAPPEGRGWLLPVLALVLLAALAGGGLWWWSQQEPPAPDPEPTPVVPEPEPEPAPTPEPEADPDPAPLSDPGQAAYERALAAIEAGECATARDEMLSAIELDHSPALLAWAERQDSLDFTPCLTETSNDISALEHYQRACAADVEGAADGLRALVAELERQADAGAGAAGDVLRLAVPNAREACGI